MHGGNLSSLVQGCDLFVFPLLHLLQLQLLLMVLMEDALLLDGRRRGRFGLNCHIFESEDVVFLWWVEGLGHLVQNALVFVGSCGGCGLREAESSHELGCSFLSVELVLVDYFDGFAHFQSK